MKQSTISKKPTNDTVLKKLNEIEHEIKLLDKKGKTTERNLSLKIMSEGADIRQELKRSIGAEIQLAIHDAEERLKEQLTAFSDKLFKMIDPILKEVEDARADRTLMVRDQEEIKETLKIHEKRITKLEKN